MQILIYKTDLVVERAPTWLELNSSVELCPQADHTVAAYVRRPPRWPSLFGASRPVRIGFLDEAAETLLRSAFEAGIALRVRIVELDPAHLTDDRRARISVSVWGNTGRNRRDP